MRQGTRRFTLTPPKLAQLLHRLYTLERSAECHLRHSSFPLLGNLVAKNQTSTANASMTSHKRSHSEALEETDRISDTVCGDAAAASSSTSPPLESVNKRVTLAVQTTGHGTWHESNHEDLLLTASPVALDVPRLFANDRFVLPGETRAPLEASINGRNNANDSPVVHYQHVAGISTIESDRGISGLAGHLHHNSPLEPPSTDTSLLRDADEPPWSLRTGRQPVSLQVSFLRPPARPKDSLEVQHGSQEEDKRKSSLLEYASRSRSDRNRAFSLPPSLRFNSSTSSSHGPGSVSSVTHSNLTSKSGGDRSNGTRPTSFADDSDSRSEQSSDGVLKSAAKPHHTWPVTGDLLEGLLVQTSHVDVNGDNTSTSKDDEASSLAQPKDEQLALLLADVGGFNPAIEVRALVPARGQEAERKCVCAVGYSLELPGSINNHAVVALPDTASSINTMSIQYARQQGIQLAQFEDGERVMIQTLTGRHISCAGWVEAEWRFHGEESLPFTLRFFVIEGSPSDVIIGYPALCTTGTLTQHKRRICKRQSKRSFRPFGAFQAEPTAQFPTLHLTFQNNEVEAIADTGASTNIMSLPFMLANQLGPLKAPIRPIRIADGSQETTEGVVLIPWSQISDLAFEGHGDGFREGTPDQDDPEDMHEERESSAGHVCEDTEIQFDVLKHCMFGVVVGREVISRVGIHHVYLPLHPNPLGDNPSASRPLEPTPPPPTPSIHAIYTQPFNGIWSLFERPHAEAPQAPSSTQGSQESIQRNAIRELKRQESRRMAQYARYVATLDDPVEIARAKRENEIDLQLFEARLAALCGGD
ncbi:hypothetical protein BDZ85DRAFT_93584 [Elsinoe ampelina]|uniref:Uncharacterized protein n=1 Tax=Elsinoe ampelina TaxID=302913 RepID=A0A6A6FZ23_9PEZI|nr:hypothetical protein BDZ85DRAFT_93584 [Elsinoe ampelina]